MFLAGGITHNALRNQVLVDPAVTQANLRIRRNYYVLVRKGEFAIDVHVLYTDMVSDMSDFINCRL